MFFLDRVSYDRRGLLKIRDVTEEDQGEYDCVATNAAGEGRNTAILNYIGMSILFTILFIFVPDSEESLNGYFLVCEE